MELARTLQLSLKARAGLKHLHFKKMLMESDGKLRSFVTFLMVIHAFVLEVG